MEVCKMYNQSLPSRLKTGDTDLQIYKIIFDCKKHEDIEVDVGKNFSGNIGSYISFLNNKTVTINGVMYNVFKVFINPNIMKVSIVYPNDSSLIDNEYFTFTERENDDRIRFRIYMRIDRDWVIMDIPIYPTTRNY